MDDSIFVDLVNALAQYEKEDKEREQTKRGKEKEEDKDRKDSSVKIEIKSEKSLEDVKMDGTPFPSIHIFNVSKTTRRFVSSVRIMVSVHQLFRQYLVCSPTKVDQKN